MALRAYAEIPLFPGARPSQRFGAEYLGQEKLKILEVFTAHSGDQLAGFCLHHIYIHPHYFQQKHSNQIVLYLDPVHRKGNNGINFINWCDRHLADIGVNFVHRAVPELKKWGKVLEWTGYKPLETFYVKQLNGVEHDRY